MQFIVGTPHYAGDGVARGYLIPDGWDDWFKYSTLYNLVIVDGQGQQTPIGSVKIGELNQQTRRPSIEDCFSKLEQNFFSLGQDSNYYETLYALETELRSDILVSLRDCAHDERLYEEVRLQDVMVDSLQRYVADNKLKHFRLILAGRAVLTPFHFTYTLPLPQANAELPLEFNVIPNSYPPTNLHAIIGRNGVGKTRCFRLLAKAISGEDPERVGKFALDDLSGSSIASVVTVAFSAFDPFERLPQGDRVRGRVRFYYVGLRHIAEDKQEANVPPDESFQGQLKSERQLTDEFVNSLIACSAHPRSERWHNSISFLLADPLFEQAGIKNLLAERNQDGIRQAAESVFPRLSSGHKVVLLTITRLVELVDEMTLLLIDEPEAHLHPPLLSAFIRALSYLLTLRNGVAIIATHSPVVLQETPASCAWLLDRSGALATARRPEIETFAENVGSLTREVFSLEVSHTGFHRLLFEECGRCNSYSELMAKFGDQIGGEGRALARAFFAMREREKNQLSL